MKLPSSQSKSPTKDSKSHTNKYYPPVGFYFDVRIVDKPGLIQELKRKLGLESVEVDSGFQDVSGLSVEIPTETISEGGENRFTYKVPLPAKHSNLVLKRGLVTTQSTLGAWCRSIIESAFSSNVKCKNLVISLLDGERVPVMVWSVVDAYPVKWTTSNFNAMNNEIAIETMEFVYKRFEIV